MNFTTDFAVFGVRGVMNGAAIIFFAYLGYDAVATLAEEVRTRYDVLHDADEVTWTCASRTAQLWICTFWPTYILWHAMKDSDMVNAGEEPCQGHAHWYHRGHNSLHPPVYHHVHCELPKFSWHACCPTPSMPTACCLHFPTYTHGSEPCPITENIKLLP